MVALCASAAPQGIPQISPRRQRSSAPLSSWRGFPPAGTRKLGLLLPNGLACYCPLPEVLQPKQHGQHSFELAVEMDLVTAEPFQLFRIERFAERLVPHERATGDFLSALIEPGEHLAFEKPAQTLDVRSGWFFILLEFIGLDLEPVRPPALRILAQLRQRSFVGVVCARSQHVERAPRHSLIVVKVSDLLFGVDGSDPDGFANV